MPRHTFSVFSFLILVFLLGRESAKAQSCNPASKSQCCSFGRTNDQTSVTRLQTLEGNCSLSVVNTNANRSFRRFGFGNDGQVSILMQPGGNSQRAMASQSFLIYPFGENPTAEPESGGRFAVNSGSGQRWVFDSRTGLPVSLSNCKLTVSPTFSLNNSGVKIDSCARHLVIETPPETGGEYIAHQDGLLTIRDPSGTSCQVHNTDLYQYITKGKNNTQDRAHRFYNIELKYNSNAQMAQQLRRLCPRLDVSMLTNSAARASTASPSPAPSPSPSPSTGRRPRLQLDLSDLPPDPPSPSPSHYPTPSPAPGTQN